MDKTLIAEFCGFEVLDDIVVRVGQERLTSMFDLGRQDDWGVEIAPLDAYDPFSEPFYEETKSAYRIPGDCTDPQSWVTETHRLREMTADEIASVYGVSEGQIGCRPRGKPGVVLFDEGVAKRGFLSCCSRDPGGGEFDTSAQQRPNYAGMEIDDGDSTYCYYYFKPLECQPVEDSEWVGKINMIPDVGIGWYPTKPQLPDNEWVPAVIGATSVQKLLDVLDVCIGRQSQCGFDASDLHILEEAGRMLAPFRIDVACTTGGD